MAKKKVMSVKRASAKAPKAVAAPAATSNGTAAPTFRERDAANAAERVRQMTGGLLNGHARGEIIDMEASDAAAPRLG